MEKPKMYANINGKISEIVSLPEIEPDPDAEIKNPIINISGEVSGSFEMTYEGKELFKRLTREACKSVDITGLPPETIKMVVSAFPFVEELVTTDAEHYASLQFTDGFICYAGESDRLYGKLIVLDKRKKIKTAKITIKKEDEGND